MPDFSYVARDPAGREVAGVQTANSPADAAAQLAARSLFPTTISPVVPKAPAFQLGKGRVSTAQIASFYGQLADLLHSGVPLLRSMDILSDQSSNPRLKEVLVSIRGDVSEGQRLAEAFRKHPSVFSELAVSMVRAGEEGGFLEEALQRVATFTEHQEEMKGRVVGAMVYPLFLLSACIIVVVGMLLFLVPQFAPIFQRLEEEGQLPTATVILLAFSGLVRNYGLPIAAVFVIAIWQLRSFLATERGRVFFDTWTIRMQMIGPILRSLAVARFCRVLGTLLKNGVPILNSLRISKDATGNRVLSEAIAAAADNISAGKSLARPLAASGQFSREVVEMIAVGEEANNLEQVLINVADNMERRTYRQLDLFVKLLEPVMLLLMACLIGFVVIALLLPVFQGAGSLG